MLLGLTALEIRHAFARAARAKQTFEHEARVVFGRERLVVRAPGEIVFVRAGVTGIAVAGLSHRIAGELERREAREMSDLVGHDLVDRNSGANVGARRSS